MFLGFLLGCFSFLACGTLASQPEIEPTALCTGRQSLDHWTARQVPGTILYTLVFPLCWNTQSVIYSDITTPPLCCQAFPPERSMEPGPLSVPACRPWAPQLCHKAKAAQNEGMVPPPVSCGLRSENATRGRSDTYSLPLSDADTWFSGSVASFWTPVKWKKSDHNGLRTSM